MTKTTSFFYLTSLSDDTREAAPVPAQFIAAVLIKWFISTNLSLDLSKLTAMPRRILAYNRVLVVHMSVAHGQQKYTQQQPWEAQRPGWPTRAALLNAQTQVRHGMNDADLSRYFKLFSFDNKPLTNATRRIDHASWPLTRGLNPCWLLRHYFLVGHSFFVCFCWNKWNKCVRSRY